MLCHAWMKGCRWCKAARQMSSDTGGVMGGGLGAHLLSLLFVWAFCCRSRWHSGEPNFAMGMFQGREHVILMRQVPRGDVGVVCCVAWTVCVCVFCELVQPNLYCSVHYWLTDEQLLRKPHSRYIWPCPVTKGYFCTKSKLCNWTNNPQVTGCLRMSGSASWFIALRDVAAAAVWQGVVPETLS